jgi:hypothetical protein
VGLESRRVADPGAARLTLSAARPTPGCGCVR